MNMVIKRSSAKELYLHAAEQIICQQGYQSVTVRRLSELTGYSYPTLYHYFTDLDDLFWAVRNRMISQMLEDLTIPADQIYQGAAGLKNALRLYAGYYLQNPNIFHFFYYHSFAVKTKPDASENGQPNLAAQWQSAFAGLIASGEISESDIPILSRLLIYSVHGMISLCFSNNGHLNSENLLMELDLLIDFLINRARS